MKLYKRFLFALLLLLCYQNMPAQGYRLVWSDEFEGSQVKSSEWDFQIGPNPSNNELQYYTSRSNNIYVSNGFLIIKALKETYGGMAYTSARISTKKSWQYGKIEARIKMPFGQGIWPAFWMLGKNIGTIGWPKCGEIDITEMIGGANDNRTFATLHWEQNGHASYGTSYALPSGKLADDFHVFSAVWTPRKVECYIDGISYYTIDISPSDLSEFRAPFFILLNLAVGGNWPGNPDASTVFPQTMTVDYVRVYEDTTLIPKVTITEPADNSSYASDSDITINTAVQDINEIDRVEFFQDDMKIGETNVSPYSWTWRSIEPGTYRLRAKAYTNNGISGSSDTVTIISGSAPTQSPYPGRSFTIPGSIEAEYFDQGGESIAYHDADAANSGAVYRRSEGPDIEECGDTGGGFNVGWINAGEWLEYSVNITETGSYEIETRAASNGTSGACHIEIDGVNVSGTVNITSTGGYQVWQNFITRGVNLTAGRKVMRLIIDKGGFNLNKFSIYKPASSSQLKLISPNGGEVWNAGSIQEIRWESLKVSTVTIGYSYNGGSSWNQLAASVPSYYGSYRWRVPSQTGSACKVIIADKANLTLRDFSDSTFTVTAGTSVDDTPERLKDYCLNQNYPNPFNPSTTILFDLPAGSVVSLHVYDLLGRLVAQPLRDVSYNAGSHELVFDGSGLASGMYIYSITAKGTDGSIYSLSKKMSLLK